ncbi:MAG: aminoglycoside phosphotransferase family protein [Pyrinomonadaceae bacterium]|nr:aminoglycoside phosphotransferase family protein [Pyrinomonadaceae bacterium]
MLKRSKNRPPAAQVNKFREMARRVVEHHLGKRPSRLNYMEAGLSNFVFEANHSDGTFIVRISPEEARLNAFMKEQWAEHAARKAGVPTAEILEIGFSVIPFPYMISARVFGTEATFHEKREKILRELGSYAAKINSIRTKGFGETFDWSKNLLSRNDSLKDYLRNEYDYESRLDVIEKLQLLTPRQIRGLRKIFKEMEGLRTKPTLNHGDLRLKNVIADENGKITAIIDWEKATSNIAPFWELSLALHDLGIDSKQAFVEGYGISTKAFTNAAPFITAFNILNYIPEIERARTEKDKAAFDHLRLRFSGAFDLYSL